VPAPRRSTYLELPCDNWRKIAMIAVKNIPQAKINHSLPGRTMITDVIKLFI
jgi:hypothetical protein